MTEQPGPLPEGLTRAELVAEVGRQLDEIPESAVVVIAASGGPDSTALAYLAAEARPDMRIILGHVRHGARDDDEDVSAVTAHASALGAELSLVSVTVEPSGEGWEAAARDERYTALCDVAVAVGATHILLGHSADDQAETVLLRIARGTGVDGLAAMSTYRTDEASDLVLVRPLLRLRGDELRRFVELEGITAVEDPMNRDLHFRRVRVREQVLPVLNDVAPDPVGALARLADLARADSEALEAIVAERVPRLVRAYGPVRVIAADDLDHAGTGLARRLVRHLLDEVREEATSVDAAHVEAVLGLERGAAVDLPGATVTCGGGWIAIAPTSVKPPDPATLQVPGRTRWSSVGLEVVAEFVDLPRPGQLALALPADLAPDPPPRFPDGAVPPGGDARFAELYLPRSIAEEELILRPRRPGDRLRTTGGTRKVQDVLVDAGVPRAMRDLVPLLVHGDELLWVAGVTADPQIIAEGRADPHVHLRLDKPL